MITADSTQDSIQNENEEFMTPAISATPSISAVFAQSDNSQNVLPLASEAFGVVRRALLFQNHPSNEVHFCLHNCRINLRGCR